MRTRQRRRRLTDLSALLAAVMVLLLAPAVPKARAIEFAGRAPVVADGESLRIDGRLVRLWGMRAPPLSLQCRDKGGQSYACGVRAREALQALIGAREVTCHQRSTIPDFGLLAACAVGGIDLGQEMVRRGWAIAERRFEGYMAQEIEARRAGEGLWSGSFSDPDLWKAKGKSPSAP
jgi:endonuclease YncB( thermonuclease family)